MPVLHKNQLYDAVDLPAGELKRINVMRQKLLDGERQVIACKLPLDHYFADNVEICGKSILASQFNESGTVRTVYLETTEPVRLT